MELWYIPYYGQCRIYIINRRTTQPGIAHPKLSQTRHPQTSKESLKLLCDWKKSYSTAGKPDNPTQSSFTCGYEPYVIYTHIIDTFDGQLDR